MGLPDNPESLLYDTLYPNDAYRGTTYWANLPARERNKFVNEQANIEARRELGVIWSMLKEYLQSPAAAYMGNFVVTGVGFFTEGYVLFSVGNILPLFESAGPQCFKHYQVCDKVWVESANHFEIVGISFGRVGVAIIGKWIGRWWGLI